MIADSSGSRSLSVSFGDVLMCAGQSNMDMTVNWPKFHADNGTAECEAAGLYTGGISLKTVAGRGNLGVNRSKHWFAVTPETLTYYSAMCWYTGKALYEHHRGKVPIGLIQGENGGTPIEKFITTESVARCKAEHNATTCAAGGPDQHFYDVIVGALTPYTVGAIFWAQASADVSPTCSHTKQYPCLERELVHSWRSALGGGSPPFVALQLHGYVGAIDPASSVFAMRLAQETGLQGVDSSAVLPTYDLNCPHCPQGSVHNTDKVDIGARVARQLRRLLYGEVVPQGPVATKASVARVGANFQMSVSFAGSTEELRLVGTRNCTECCSRAGADFDVSINGSTWVNGSAAKVIGSIVTFDVELPQAPTLLRYTASVDFPQCAVYDSQGLPAFPFQMAVVEEESKLLV